MDEIRVIANEIWQSDVYLVVRKQIGKLEYQFIALSFPKLSN